MTICNSIQPQHPRVMYIICQPSSLLKGVPKYKSTHRYPCIRTYQHTVSVHHVSLLANMVITVYNKNEAILHKYLQVTGQIQILSILFQRVQRWSAIRASCHTHPHYSEPSVTPSLGLVSHTLTWTHPSVTPSLDSSVTLTWTFQSHPHLDPS